MELPEADQYYRDMVALEAQELLTQYRVQDWSHMEQSKREQRWAELMNQAFPGAPKEKKKEVSNKEIASWIMGALGG